MAAMCAALGARTTLLGVTGDDSAGKKVLQLLAQQSVDWRGLTVPHRSTIVKERIFGVSRGQPRQLLARLDRECARLLRAEDVVRLVELIPDLGDFDVVLISDYAKGSCVEPLVAAVKRQYLPACPVLVDPPRGQVWDKYHGMTALIPNRHEACGRDVPRLCATLELAACVVKQDEEGADLYLAHSPLPVRVPAIPRQVREVTGAGDQFLATLGLAYVATGHDWLQAAIVATIAAGLQVERSGCEPVRFTEVARDCGGVSEAAEAGRVPDAALSGRFRRS